MIAEQADEVVRQIERQRERLLVKLAVMNWRDSDEDDAVKARYWRVQLIATAIEKARRKRATCTE